MTDEQLKEQALRISKLIGEKIMAAKEEAVETDPKNKEENENPYEDFPADFKEILDKMVHDQLDIERIKTARETRPSGGFNKAQWENMPTIDDDRHNPDNINWAPAKVYSFDKETNRKYYGAALSDKLEEFKELQDAVCLAGLARAHKTRRNYFDAVAQTRIFGTLQTRLKSDAELRKALDTATSGEGADWIPTGFSSQLFDLVRLELRVGGLFQTFNMPTNPFRFPVTLTDATAYKIPESTADSSTKITASTPGTTNLELSAVKIAARALFSDEVSEDSAVNMLDFVRTNVSRAIADGIEKAHLDGDDSATHQDADVTDVRDVRTSFKGHRYWALNNAGTATKDFSNADPTTALLRSTRALMDKAAVDPNKLAWVFSPNGYIKLLSVSETTTWEKFREQATLLTGQLFIFDGIPVIVSQHVRTDLNASGVQDGVTTDRGVIHLIYRPGFMTGIRRGVTVDTQRDIETDQMILVSKIRLDHEDIQDATLAANIHTVLGYNVKTT